MIKLTKAQIGEVIMDNRYKLTGEEKPFFTLDEVKNKAQEKFHFILEEKEEVNPPMVAFSRRGCDGAIIYVKGEWGIKEEYETVNDFGRAQTIDLCVFQQTVMGKYNREYAKKIYETEKEHLFENCDEEYLYEIFSEVCDDMILDWLSAHAHGLPIFEVIFTNDKFHITDLGIVQPIDNAAAN